MGIVRHFTAPYTPQHNGIVERRNRTPVAMGRSLLKERNMPSNMWGEAIRHAVYLLNRLPTRAVEGATPYESWTKRKPQIEHLKVFGCIAYMKVPNVHTTKLDSRSMCVIHLGREAGTKAYRLFNPDTGRVHVSRDVVFDETKGWNWTNEDDTQVSSSFIVAGALSEATQDESLSNTDDSMDSERSGTGDNYMSQSHQSPQTGSSQAASPVTVSSQATRSQADNVDNTYDGSVSPRHYRSLSEIYDETEQVQLDEEAADELLFAGVDEPVYYAEAVKEN